MQALIGLPVTITIVEGGVFKEIFKVHRVINSGAVVSILMTDLLEGIHSLDTARYHLRNCADTEISALLDHLTELFLDILAPGSNLCRNLFVAFVDFFPCTTEKVCEDVFSVSIDLTKMLSVLIRTFVLHLGHKIFLVLV